MPDKSNLWAGDYPPPAFYFKVVFDTASGMSNPSFMEVEGLSIELDVTEVKEGGENGFVHKLPGRFKNTNITLKRGLAPITSPFCTWCKSIFKDGVGSKIELKNFSIYLMDEKKIPIRRWSIQAAYPVKWSVSSFDSMKNEIVIESIELVHHGLIRNQ